MARKVVTDEQLAALGRRYREHPPTTRADHVAAAEAVAVDWRTARRAWDRGWPGRRAIRDEVIEEQVLARARLRRDELTAERAAAPALAAEDAAAVLAREALLARAAREATLGLLAGLSPVGRYAAAVVEKLRVLATSEGFEANEAMQVLRAATACVRDATEAAYRAVQLERLRLGEPTDSMSITVGAPPMSMEEAEATVVAAQRALARAQQTTDDDDEEPSQPRATG